MKIFLSLAASAFFFIILLSHFFLNTHPVNPDYFATYPPTELVYEHFWDSSVLTGEKILKGEKVSGHFIAQINRLGTVALKFDTFNRINNDQIIFRIKEKGAKTWFYENAYNTDPIRQEVFWPFGFPLIADSQGKTYEFEIESRRGEDEQAIAINPLQKFFISKYSYPKQWLLENKKEIPSFVFQKITSAFRRLNKKDQLSIGLLTLVSLLLPFLIRELTIFLIFFLSKFIKIPLLMAKKLPESKTVEFLRFMPTYFFLGTLLLITKLFASLIFILRIISKIISKIFAKVPFLIIVSFLLLFLTIASCFFDKQVFQEDSSLRDLVHWHQWPASSLTGKEILAGEKITGEFKAPENRLGTLIIKIYDFGRDNQDQLVLRLKEKNTSSWLFQKAYETSPIRGSFFWPFGFPVIENSKSKTYEFEIESTKGSPGNAIALVRSEKLFLSKYAYSGSWLWHNKKEILPFIFKKIFLPFSRLDTVSWKHIIVLPLVPLIIYLFGLHKISRLSFSLKAKGQKNIFNLEIKKSHYLPQISKNDLEIFLKLAIVLILMIVPFSIFSLIMPLPKSEQTEWLIYEISPIVAFIIFLTLGFLFKKKRFILHVQKIINFFLFMSLVFFLSIMFLKDLYPRQIAFFLPIACLPIALVIKEKYRKTSSIMATLKMIFNHQYFLINLLGIFGVFSFFYETLLHNPNNRSIFLAYLLIIGILGYLILNYQVSFKWPFKKNGRFPNFLGKIILIVSGSLLLFIAIHREIFLYAIAIHTYYYVGPGLDIINHKSLLYDTPSQYGYLSMHFVAALQKIYGFTIGAFIFFNSLLYIISTVIAGFIFFKLTKKLFWTVILSLIYIGFQTFFSDYNSFLYPSSGPLRFGFGLLIIFFLLYFPNWLSFIFGTILASVSVFWAAETAMYIVPAWIFTCLVIAWTKHGLSRAFLKESLLKTIAFFITTLLLTLMIIIKEYRPGYGFPPLWNILDYAMASTNGLNSILMPTYGNHYLAILILVFGLGVLLHLLVKKSYPKVLPALTFIVIHNIAIFSYFVNRSWYSLVIGLAGFFLIEVVLIYKAIQKTKEVNQQKFKAYFGLPIVIFSVLFIAKCYNLFPDEITMFKYNLSQLSVYKVQPKPLLTQIAENYKVNTQKVVLLSIYDTLYLSEVGAKNLLSLNPNSMTFALPDWREKYLNPQINNLPSGIIFIFDDSLVDWDPTSHVYLNEIRKMIEEKYELILLGEIKEKKVKVFKILGKKILPQINQN